MHLHKFGFGGRGVGLELVPFPHEVPNDQVLGLVQDIAKAIRLLIRDNTALEDI